MLGSRAGHDLLRAIGEVVLMRISQLFVSKDIRRPCCEYTMGGERTEEE